MVVRKRIFIGENSRIFRQITKEPSFVRVNYVFKNKFNSFKGYILRRIVVMYTT